MVAFVTITPICVFMHIYDNNKLYNFILRYMFKTISSAYSEVSIVGRENIPTDGAVLFAPNHTNALMDALSVLLISQKPTVFVARADMFKNKTLAKILNFFKIMPIMRIRDGRENMKKNDEIIAVAAKVLEHKVPFCIFCEGTHRMKHSMLPIVKGICRIAVEAENELNGKMPLYIVPVGIEYGSYVKYCSTLSLNVGKAINVSEFIQNHKEDSYPKLLVELKELLAPKIAELIHYVDDNENYDALLDLSYLRNSTYLNALNLNSSPYNVMVANRKFIDEFHNIEKKSTSKAEHILQLGRELALLRKGAKIADESLLNPASVVNIISCIIVLIVFLPYFLYSIIISSPIILISQFIISKNDDKAFNNSIRYSLSILVTPIILILLAIILLCITKWYLAILLLLISVPVFSFTHKYVRLVRIVISDIKYRSNKKIKNLVKSINDYLK